MRKLLLPFALLAACGGSHHTDSGADDLAVSTDASVSVDLALELADLSSPFDIAAAPIVATANQWTWVDVDGAVCNDGSQTGIGVNPGSDPSKMLVFFNGGGACGDYASCYTLETASLGPFGQAQFDEIDGDLAGSIFDRTLANNPFSTWTMVFVPYCTGDLHGGIKAVSYTSDDGKNMGTFHHMGHINVLRDLDRLSATWPTLSTLVVSGSSAGGYGSIINYDAARQHWASAKGYLIDDSGPPLERNITPPNLTSWIASWGLLDWALGPCPGCGTDVSQLIPSASKLYPNDSLSLLSSLQDQVIRGFYLVGGPDFQTALTQVATDRIDPLSNFKYFFIPGDSHTMLGNPASYASGSTSLMTFINQEVGNDAAWTSHTP